MVSATDLQTMYEQMVTARHYGKRLVDEYLVGRQPAFDISTGPIPGELHLTVGHKAFGAGVCMHPRDDDTVTVPHRPHHIAIAKGVDLKRMTAEIFGRKTGLYHGKGSRMHLFDPDVSFACAGIITQGCPSAVGAAMAAKKRNADPVAVTFLGGGTIDQDDFLESLNLAAVHDLPVVFVVEGNDWAVSIPKDRMTNVQSDAQRAADFDLPGIRIGSDDTTAVYEAAGEAVMRVRDGNGPTLIEVQVHRRVGHSMGDAEAYRPEADTDRVKQRNSIERLATDLRLHGVVDDDIDEMRKRVHGQVEAAISWAKEQPEPEPTEAYENVFTNPPAQAAIDDGSAADAPGDTDETRDDN